MELPRFAGSAPPLLDLLALFFRSVESKGQWPAYFNLALVAMLHKGGTSELDDFRPIVMLNTIYKLWAGLRSRVLRSWLSANGLLPSTNGRGADTQAYELSLRLALARLSGVTVSGLAIDWSKCYDSLPLRVLQDLSNHLGLPDRLWRPMLDMYSRPRVVLLQGGIGQALAPTQLGGEGQYGLRAGSPYQRSQRSAGARCRIPPAAEPAVAEPRALDLGGACCRGPLRDSRESRS